MIKKWVTLFSVLALGISATADILVSDDFGATPQSIVDGPAYTNLLGAETGTPGHITVDTTGWAGLVTGLTVTLQMEHNVPESLEIFLVNPGGEGCWLMGDAGGASDLGGVGSTVALSFNDSGAAVVGDNAEGWGGSPYIPNAPYDNPPSAPGAFVPAVTDVTLNTLADLGSTIDGEWLLYIYDDNTDGSAGVIDSWGINYIGVSTSSGGGGGGGGPGSNASTPEPSAALLGLVALVGVVTKRRRRQG